MIVPTSNLFKLAYGKYAIGAYNINNLEQTLGLFKGCIESQAPFIIQLSKGARKYADKGMLEVNRNGMLAWTLRACANKPCCLSTQASRSQRRSLAFGDRSNRAVTKVHLAEVNK